MIFLHPLLMQQSMRTLKYIISLSFFLSGFGSWAQEAKKDFKPSELIVGVDAIRLGKTLFTDETQLEFHSRIDFHQYYLAGEFGIDKTKASGNGFDYSAEGTFFRVGPQVNMMPYNKHRSSIYFGLMYARSSFSDQIIYDTDDTGWGAQSITYSNDNLTARWYEANVGINVKVLGPLYLGYTVRFKFAKKLSGAGELQPFEIPGFGEANKGSRFGLNYYLIYKLRYRDKPIPKRPTKRAEEPESRNPPR